jgi:multisubunit Na+/H+ antiporter MnhG subunit
VSVEDAAVYALVAAALATAAICCAGLLLTRNAFDRLHFVAPASLAAILLAVAILVREGPTLIALMGGVLVAVVLVGSPLATHATARAARIGVRGDWRPGRDEPVEREGDHG